MTLIGREEWAAREIARYISLAYDCAAGTAREKEVILPAKHWSVLMDTVQFWRINWRRVANLAFLSSGIIKAWRTESNKRPKNLILVWGTATDFERPMKSPRDTRTANNEGSGLGQSKIGPCKRLLNISTQTQLANMLIVNVLTTGNTQEANVISSC